MAELTEKSLIELASLVRRGAESPVTILEAHLARIHALNPSLRAIVTLNPNAREQALAAENALTANEPLGPLHGVPITVKDTIETAGLRTSAGSRLLKRNVPEKDAPVVARLKAAGAIILGKTNTSELATAYDAENPLFGRTNNPYDLTRTPGGSSGGEAAAISACLSPAGLGSDLAGSIRIPAHFCGIVGLKPTSGAVDNAGQWPRAVGPLGLSAMLGPLARRVADVYLLWEILNLRRRYGSRSYAAPAAFLTGQAQRLAGRKFAWYADDGQVPVLPEVHAAVAKAAQELEKAGLNGTNVVPAGVTHGPHLWAALLADAVGTQISELYTPQLDQAGPAIQALLRAHRKRSVPDWSSFMTAWAERDAQRAKLLAFLEEHLFIVAPVGAVAACSHGAHRVTVNGQEMSLFRAFGAAQTFNVYGLPAVTVRVGETPEGLPVGVQIVGRPHAEHEIMAAATILETALGGWVKPQLAAQL